MLRYLMALAVALFFISTSFGIEGYVGVNPAYAHGGGGGGGSGGGSGGGGSGGDAGGAGDDAGDPGDDDPGDDGDDMEPAVNPSADIAVCDWVLLAPWCQK